MKHVGRNLNRNKIKKSLKQKWVSMEENRLVGSSYTPDGLDFRVAWKYWT